MLPRPSLSAAVPGIRGGLFSNSEGVRVVAEAYFALHPEERDPGRLAQLMFSSRLPGCAAALDRWTAEHAAADFSRGDSVIIAGWVLARSEARLCALSFLAGGNVS